VETGDEVRASDGVGTGDGVSDVDVDIVVNGDGKFGMGVSITIMCKQVVLSGVLDERSRKVRALMKVCEILYLSYAQCTQ
jgi:hypothetical protein